MYISVSIRILEFPVHVLYIYDLDGPTMLRMFRPVDDLSITFTIDTTMITIDITIITC